MPSGLFYMKTGIYCKKSSPMRNILKAESLTYSATAEEIPRVFQRNHAHVRNATVCVKPRGSARVDWVSSQL